MVASAVIIDPDSDLGVGSTSCGQARATRIAADDSPKCRVDYADSYISLVKRLEDEDDGEVHIQFVKENPLWVSDSGVVMGWAQEKKEKIARLNPFAHLAKTIRRAFEGGMDKSKCESLIHDIEVTPPEEYEPGSGWIKEFVRDKMDEGMQLSKSHGKVSD
ncbi:hypothetical protein FOZ63_007434 [Perkinsus olseni]|uniref:Uncharacterized protein n=1 Tax=Perkinsus olseni TaxID=32597 RepID=A0A7J6S593_PEROL|nr:hypothetical protein FOZ63_007434 [Perkinsus olseni]